MSKPLTVEQMSEQIAQVARVVNPDTKVIVHNNLPYLDGHMLWTPRFDHCHQCRSQALALVEFLADHVQYQWKMIQKYHQAIRDKDINTLQAMVLELSEKS